MTIRIHSLQYSRAVRVAWLLEELGVPYEVVRYERTGAYKAPEALKRVHPLGKSPVVEDGEIVLAESAAILRHLQRTLGAGRFVPEDVAGQARHDEWLDYAEGTFARPVAAAFWARRNGTELDAAARDQIDLHMSHIDAHMAGRDFVMGNEVTLADMQMLYLLAMARYADVLEGQATNAWLDRMVSRDALDRAVAKTGPIMPDG